MTRCVAVLMLLLGLAVAAPAQTNEAPADQPLPGFARDLRISAMIKNADGIEATA